MREGYVLVGVWDRRGPKRVKEPDRLEYETWSRDYVSVILDRVRWLHPSHKFYLVHCREKKRGMESNHIGKVVIVAGCHKAVVVERSGYDLYRVRMIDGPSTEFSSNTLNLEKEE